MLAGVADTHANLATNEHIDMLAGWVNTAACEQGLSLGCVAHTGGAVFQHHRPGRGLADHQNSTGIHDWLPKVAQTPLS